MQVRRATTIYPTNSDDGLKVCTAPPKNLWCTSAFFILTHYLLGCQAVSPREGDTPLPGFFALRTPPRPRRAGRASSIAWLRVAVKKGGRRMTSLFRGPPRKEKARADFGRPSRASRRESRTFTRGTFAPWGRLLFRLDPSGKRNVQQLT